MCNFLQLSLNRCFGDSRTFDKNKVAFNKDKIITVVSVHFAKSKKFNRCIGSRNPPYQPSHLGAREEEDDPWEG